MRGTLPTWVKHTVQSNCYCYTKHWINFKLRRHWRKASPACHRKKWQERGENISRLKSEHISVNNFCSPYHSTRSNAHTVGKIQHNLRPCFLISIAEFQDCKHCFRSGIFTVVRRTNWKTTTTTGYLEEPLWHLCLYTKCFLKFDKISVSQVKVQTTLILSKNVGTFFLPSKWTYTYRLTSEHYGWTASDRRKSWNRISHIMYFNFVTDT